jgi:hypothetical protein
MPHVTLKVTQEGYELPVMVGLPGRLIAAAVAAGQPSARPLLVQGILDTGSNITTVNQQVIQQLRLPPLGQQTTQTPSGSSRVNLYEASFSIPPMGRLTAPLLVLDSLVIMEPAHPLSDIDVLVGRDVIAYLLSILDGPGGEFTLAD